MRPWQRLLAAALTLLPAVGIAEPVGYAVGSGGSGVGGGSSLYRIDLATGAAIEVGPIGYVDVEGAAFSPGGMLYAVADSGVACEGACPGGTDVLLRIDTATGAGALVGPLGLAGVGPSGQLDYGLAFTCDGQLWLSSDTTGQLWIVDPTNGAAQLRGTLGAPVSGLAGLGDQLYGISVAPDLGLFRIDTNDGSATRLGSLGLPDAFYDAGLAFDAAGGLWASIDYLPPPDSAPLIERNDIAQINRTTGAAVISSAVTGAGSGIFTVQMEGLAIAAGAGCSASRSPTNVPVGGPGITLSLACLLLIVGATRLRRG